MDGGQHWAQYKGSKFPAVAVRDIVVHPRESDLVLATHGRGIWIIDDISPLRALTPDLMAKDAASSRTAGVQYFDAKADGQRATRPSRPQPTHGRLHHLLPEGAAHLWRLEDRNFRPERQAAGHDCGQQAHGLNRATWSMRLKPPIVPPAATALFGAAQGRGLCPAHTP